jgi:hypothetical protein
MFLPDKIAADQRLDITPWGLDGVNQKGPRPDGESLSG